LTFSLGSVIASASNEKKERFNVKCGDSLVLQRLLGHTTLMMTSRYCQAVGCYDVIEAHKRYNPVDRLS